MIDKVQLSVIFMGKLYRIETAIASRYFACGYDSLKINEFLSINGEFFPILRQAADLLSQRICAAPASQILTILVLRKIRSFMDQKPQ